MGTLSIYATELLAKTAGSHVAAQAAGYAAAGAVVGGTYGAFSDTSSLTSGAFKGAVLGGTFGTGLKALGNRYMSGYNAHMASLDQVFSKGTGSFSESLTNSSGKVNLTDPEILRQGIRATASLDAFSNITNMSNAFSRGSFKDWYKPMGVDMDMQGKMAMYQDDLLRHKNYATAGLRREQPKVFDDLMSGYSYEALQPATREYLDGSLNARAKDFWNSQVVGHSSVKGYRTQLGLGGY